MTNSATLEETPAPVASGSAFPWAAATSPVLNADTTQRLVAALPEDTFQLIVREAYLFRAGQIMFEAMNEAKARQELVTSSRPPFFAFRRSETRNRSTRALPPPARIFRFTSAL